MNYSVNNMKMICALIVVAIHCSLFIDISWLLRTEFINIFNRVPVPFFICVTGYYLTVKLQKNKGYIDKTIKKLVSLYMFWSFFYLLFIKIPFFIKNGWGGAKK